MPSPITGPGIEGTFAQDALNVDVDWKHSNLSQVQGVPPEPYRDAIANHRARH